MPDSVNRLVVTEGQLRIINAGKPGPKGDTGATGPQGPVGPSGAATAIMDAASLTAMRSLDSTAHQVLLQGGATPLDGKTGLFVWDPDSTETADDVLVVAPTAGGTGRWRRWQPDGMLNARWFGATGDGTTDDTTALQAWLNASAALGQPGYLPPGAYLTGDLTLSGAANGSPRISGAGWNQTTLLAKTGTGTVLTIAPAAGEGSALMATVEHLTINGGGVANYGIYLADTVSRSTIRQCQVWNCTGTPGAGIANANRNYSTVIDRCITSFNNYGIQFGGSCQDLKVVNSQLFGNFSSQAALGNTSAPTNIMTLENCQIERANAGSGGDVSNIIVQNCTQLVIRSCYFESHTTAGSNDITVLASTLAAKLCNIYIDGMFANGNSVANSSIILPSDTATVVNLVLMQPRLLGYLVNPTNPIANATVANKHAFQISQTGTILAPVGSGPAQFDNGITFLGNGPQINATSGNLYLNYGGGGAGGIIFFDGKAGAGREIMRTDPVAHAVRIGGNTNAGITAHLSATAAWTPGTIANGAIATTTVNVANAALGNTVTVGFSQPIPAGCLLVGAVTAAGVVTITLLNQSGSSQTFAAGTLRASCTQY